MVEHGDADPGQGVYEQAFHDQGPTAGISCSAVGEILGSYIDGLTYVPEPFDPDYDLPGSVPYKWWDEESGRAVVVGLRPNIADLEEVRAGDVYGAGGIGPDYDIVGTDRLRALGAAAVKLADSDLVEEPNSLASVQVHTSTLHVSVATLALDPALEIATRLAERYGRP